MSLLDLKNVILILVAHYVGDFVLQTTDMRKYKYDSIYYLSIHIVVYTLTMLLFLAYSFGFSRLWLFYVFVNGCFHFIIDTITIKTIKEMREMDRDEVIPLALGTDQLLHLVTLFCTFYVFDLFNI